MCNGCDGSASTAHVRTVDPAQYQHLTDNFDFDMTMDAFGESDSPGNELWDFWGCASAKQVGSDNLMRRLRSRWWTR